MNKLSKFAYVAAAVLVTSSASAQSTLAEYQPTNVDWSNRNGESVWTNGTNEIFWQDSLSKTDNNNRLNEIMNAPVDLESPVEASPPQTDLESPVEASPPQTDLESPVEASPPPVDLESPVEASPPPVDLESPVEASPPPVDLESPVEASPPPVDLESPIEVYPPINLESIVKASPPVDESASATVHMVTYHINTLFDFGKKVLKPISKRKLSKLSRKILGMDTKSILVTGYTDRIGSNKYNDLLSLERAKAVKSYLISQGIPASQLYAEGKGKSKPLAHCNQKDRKNFIACLSSDRRVDITVTKMI